MNLTFEQILLILALILPIVYKYSFWFYTIQLKEYRWDRFREYILSPQWKRAIFNFWFFIELPLFIVSFSVFFDKWLELILFPVIFWFLVIYNIFVIWKIKRKKILVPKLTSRMVITLSLFIIWWSIDLYFMLFGGYWSSIYIYIIWSLLFAPIVIFFYILLTLPLVQYKKNKQINSAIKKSEKINEVIKIWITGSYWKSSVKEFLSSILEQDNSSSSPKGTNILVKGQEILLKTPENKNTEMSVSALVLSRLNNKFKYFIAEMWAYKIGEIGILWKIVNHKIWFLTAIGNQHIGLFWNQENISKWKFEIYESVAKNNWVLYVNWDCEEILKYLDKAGKINKNSPIIPFQKGDEQVSSNIIKYGMKSEKNLDAISKIISVENWKTKFSFYYKKIKSECEIKLIWEHNIVNITWVIACCIDLGLKIEDIKKYLKNLKSPENTKTIKKSWDNILIDDTYNLSEAGLKSGVDLFQNYDSSYNKILILDDILELWKESEKIHFNIWREIAEEKIVNEVLFCWVNYREYFVNWLLQWWFSEENVLFHLNDITWKNIILFEGKRAKTYL